MGCCRRGIEGRRGVAMLDAWFIDPVREELLYYFLVYNAVVVQERTVVYQSNPKSMLVSLSVSAARRNKNSGSISVQKPSSPFVRKPISYPRATAHNRVLYTTSFSCHIILCLNPIHLHNGQAYRGRGRELQPGAARTHQGQCPSCVGR